MSDDTIIKYYRQGFTIDCITKKYYKYKNRNSKPVVLGDVVLYPAKIYTKSDCRLYVCQVIYDYLINGDMAHTQTGS